MQVRRAAIAYKMMDSIRGLTVRMFKCDCGSKAGRKTESKPRQMRASGVREVMICCLDSIVRMTKVLCFIPIYPGAPAGLFFSPARGSGTSRQYVRR